MDETPNLNLPYIAAAQAQKHVTHNEAIRMLDALVQLSVEGIENTPPASPEDGARYIIGSSATGEWTGHENAIAAWQDGAWEILVPQTGWLAYDQASGGYLGFDNTNWTSLSSDSAPKFGINTSGDSTNRLAVSSAAVLFTHAGDDQRLVMNRAAPHDIASLQFQTGYNADAEIGTFGDGDLGFKTKLGTSLASALTVHSGKAIVSMPQQTGLRVAMAPGVQTITTGTTPLAFPSVKFDRGIDWSITNHEFTAPADGLYMVAANLQALAGTSAAKLGFAIDGTMDTASIKEVSGTEAVCMTQLLSLTTGNTVDLRTDSPHGTLQLQGDHCSLAIAKIA
ncbi:MAG: DUF2793 domain-containing protein [Pseudomonadota bacterium]